MSFSPITVPSTPFIILSTPISSSGNVEPTINVMELYPYIESSILPHGSRIWFRESNGRLKSYDVINIQKEH